MICERHKDIPENVEMADEQWFDHFLHCIPVEQRLRVITGIRQSARVGHACIMGNHDITIANQARYTAKLLTGIREIVAEYEGIGVINGSTITAKLQALIS